MKLKPTASLDTKHKIMQEAFVLFGQHGFEGTSVRQIADRSGVNLAAINYHFKSKEGLFWEIMVQTYVELSDDISQYAKNSKDINELALKTYDHFLKEKYALVNTMKMLLTDGIKAPVDNPKALEVLNDPMGPPGGIYFAQMIQKEIPYSLSREGVLWGVKSIFGCVFHWATMICAEQPFDEEIEVDPLMTKEQIRKDVEQMIESSVLYLKARRDLFEDKT